LRRESRTRSASRFIVFCAVLLLHFALLTFLVISARTRLTLLAARPLELVYLPLNIAQEKSQKTSLPLRKEKSLTRSKAVTESASAPQKSLSPVAPPEESTPSIAWDLEAQSVAADIASRSSAPTANDPPPKSAFRPPPDHHLGDEFVTTEGDRAVFITKNCYIVSKTFTDPPNAISNGMGTPVYCKRGNSHSPLGDLFDFLKR
jgi:hypothetical protein